MSYFLGIFSIALQPYLILLRIYLRRNFDNSLFSGLVVPDVPLEETEILRREATKKNIELVGFVFKIPVFTICIKCWLVMNNLKYNVIVLVKFKLVKSQINHCLLVKKFMTE